MSWQLFSACINLSTETSDYCEWVSLLKSTVTVMRFVQKARKVLFFPSCSRYFILMDNDYKLKIDLSSLLLSVHFVRKDLRFEILLMTLKKLWKLKNFWSWARAQGLIQKLYIVKYKGRWMKKYGCSLDLVTFSSGSIPA